MENLMTVSNNEVPMEFVNEDYASELIGTGNRATMFCSFEAKTPDMKKMLFNAMNSGENRISDYIGETISIKDVFCETVEMINEETGEKNVAPRVVLIDENGECYSSVSFGIFNSLKKLMQVFGMPTWHEPVKVKVKQINKKDKRLFTLEVV